MQVPIVFCVDANYGQYLPVAVQSIMDNASAGNEYHLIIFDCGIRPADLAVLARQIARKPHLTLRVENIISWLDKHKKAFKERKFWTAATYGRLLVPELCADYEKVIYADADMIFNRDMAELINIDLGDNYIAGVADVARQEKGGKAKRDAAYISEVLQLQADHIYINAGLLLFNVKIWREKHLTEKSLALLANKSLKRLDQDAINSVCAGKIAYLNNSWNNIGFQAHCLEKDGTFAKRIIHYVSSIKPWHSFSVNGANVWWHYAAKTEIHGRLLADALTFNNQAELARQGKPLAYRLLGIPLFSVRAWPYRKKYYAGKMHHRHIAELRFDRRTGYLAFYLFEMKIFSRNS